ncbi:hypothetical protein PMIN06_008465 [Paraphaeosphaeria minitans]
MLVVLGLASALEKDAPTDYMFHRFLANAIIEWSGAFWLLNRMFCFYDFSTVMSVALSVYEQWQWPSFLRSVKDAWSVSQMWSVVYHHICGWWCIPYYVHVGLGHILLSKYQWIVSKHVIKQRL